MPPTLPTDDRAHPTAAPAAADSEHLSIIYCGNDWSAENRTSSHHIATRLGAACRMVYVECPGMRPPSGSRRDVGRVFRKLAAWFRGTRDSGAGFPVATLIQFPFHRFGVVRWINRHLARWSLRRLARRHRLRNVVLYMTIPHTSPLIGTLGERLVVYYCTDDHASFPGVHADAVRSMDEEATRKADLVFVASETLLSAKRALNPHTVLSPHGVDAAHFASARDASGPIPPEIAELRRPVIGYFGLVERWMDWELVDWLAARRPDWQFVIVGRVAIPEGELPNRPNVHFLGKRPYADLPAYGRRFDATIIPSRLDHQFAQHASPLKLREYLAMGAPVVATATPENRKFADVIALAENRDDFLEHLTRAVATPITPAAAERRMARVADQTWDARAATVLDAIRVRLAERKHGVART